MPPPLENNADQHEARGWKDNTNTGAKRMERAAWLTSRLLCAPCVVSLRRQA